MCQSGLWLTRAVDELYSAYESSTISKRIACAPFVNEDFELEVQPQPGQLLVAMLARKKKKKMLPFVRRG